MDTVPVVEKQIVKMLTVKSITVRICNVALYESVTVAVDLLDTMGIVVDNRTIIISGADYEQWTNDDRTLLQIVARKLDLTLE
jgi:hypothetical protein